MPAPTYNFQIEQGSFFEISFQYNDENGNPIDLSSANAVLQWAEPNTSSITTFASNDLASQNSDNYTLSCNNLGQINFSINSVGTKNLDFDTVTYDLDVIASGVDNELTSRILTGSINLVKRNFPLQEFNAAQGGTVTEEVTPTPAASSSDVSPTPTPSSLPVNEFEDLCLPADCTNLDVFSFVYTGDSFDISDYQNNSGTITVENTGVIENFEVAINGLRHDSPQDLVIVLTPPTNVANGSGILLSANSKIPSYVSGTSFSFMFSNKADPTSYLHNIQNGSLCNIFDKTDLVRFEGSELLSTFDNVVNSSISGVWTLNIQDTDVGVSGSIDSWKIIATYPAPEETEE